MLRVLKEALSQSQNNGELGQRNDLMRTIEIGFRMAGIALQSTQWTQWTREK